MSASPISMRSACILLLSGAAPATAQEGGGPPVHFLFLTLPAWVTM